jgi:hypothetical protein
LRTRQYMYARTKDKPWFLFDLKDDPWEKKNLVDDPTRKALVQEFDDRLASVMRQTGDSWDIKATPGDLDLWLPGGPKQQSQNLGVPFPGQAAGAGAGEQKKKAKAARRAKRQKAGARERRSPDRLFLG